MRCVVLRRIVCDRSSAANNRRRLIQRTFGLEPFEERELLSFLQPFGNKFDRVRSGGVLDVIAISGPGQVFAKRINRSTVAISLAGTTQDSQVTVSSLGARPGEANSPLNIRKIRVQTGRLGSFQGLTTTNLMGRVSPLRGIVNSLQFDSLGPAAQITVIGNLGQLTVNQGIDLGKTGQIYVSNDLTGSLSVTRDVDLDGGQIVVGQDLNGSVALGGNLALADDGRFVVGRNLGATASMATADTINGNLSVDSGSDFSIGGNLLALTVNGNIEASGNGVISVNGVLTTLTVNGGGGGSVTGNVTLSSGGELVVGQNLGTLTVGSNIVTSTSGKIQVDGNLGTLSVGGGIMESTGGAVAISTDLTGSLSVSGAVSLNGGIFSVGRDLTGTVGIAGNFALTNSGQFTVGRNLGATASMATDTITGNLTVDSGSEVSVGANLSALMVNGNVEVSGNGVISVTGVLTTLTVSGGGGSSATGNVTLGSGGLIDVAGDLNTFSIGSDLQTSGGGEVEVGGDLGDLAVSGVIYGKGSEDVVVGDDLGQLTVLGGGNNTFSVNNVDIAVSENIQGLDIRNGITDSLITAGILINGGTPGTGANGWNIGSNGSDAVFDSQILAGYEIDNLTIGGNVESDTPSNRAGLPTRIVAGEYPENTYVAGGVINNFQIVGNLIDSVIAASVEPYNGTYPQPAAGPNSTAPPFADPSVPMTIVLAGGSINASYASSSGMPSTLTLTGAVITSIHVYTADYAGIFAANTAGVQVGTPST